MIEVTHQAYGPTVPKLRTERAGTILAWSVLPLVLVAVVLSALPVDNGRVQVCGAPLAFVAQGRAEVILPDVDRPGVEDSPPLDFSEAEYRDAAEHPCRERVGVRMAWAAAAVTLAFLLGLAGVVATLVGRYWLMRPARIGAAPPADPPAP